MSFSEKRMSGLDAADLYTQTERQLANDRRYVKGGLPIIDTALLTAEAAIVELDTVTAPYSCRDPKLAALSSSVVSAVQSLRVYVDQLQKNSAE